MRGLHIQRSESIRITQVERKSNGDWCELAATICELPYGGDFRLSFRFPIAFENVLTSRADPFLAALLPAAVANQQPLVLEAPVSWRLLEQVHQQMEIWNWRTPTWKPVPVEADPSHAQRRGDAVGSFFSGGIDSFYTLLKNHDLEQGSHKISHLLCVRGFDIRYDNSEVFDRVADRLEPVAEEVGVQLIRIQTNMRELTDRFVGWQYHQMGAGLAAVGLCLGPLLHRVLIPAGDTALLSFLVAPSNPISDPLWSTDETEFVHDGCEASRLQKIRWRIADSDLALGHLRVCYANYKPDTNTAWNCGQCEKCLRTMSLLEAAGALDKCGGFDGVPFDYDRVRRIAVDQRHSVRQLEEARQVLIDDGRLPALTLALDGALAPHRRWLPRARLILLSLLERLLGRPRYLALVRRVRRFIT